MSKDDYQKNMNIFANKINAKKRGINLICQTLTCPLKRIIQLNEILVLDLN